MGDFERRPLGMRLLVEHITQFSHRLAYLGRLSALGGLDHGPFRIGVVMRVLGQRTACGSEEDSRGTMGNLP